MMTMSMSVDIIASELQYRSYGHGHLLSRLSIAEVRRSRYLLYLKYNTKVSFGPKEAPEA